MSRRIRTLKPEWLEDEALASLSDEARLLSVALILMADDYGNGRGHPAYLASQVWTYRNTPETLARVSRASRELVASGFVQFYEVNGQRYFHVVGWEKHQRVDKPSRPMVPGPEAGTAVNDFKDFDRSSRDSRETLATLSGDSRETLATDLDQDLDQDQDQNIVGVPPTQAPPKADAVRQVFDAWLEEHVDPSQRSKCKLNGKRREKIRARLREGYSAERLIAAIRGVKFSPWHMGENPEGKRYTDLATILRDGAQVEKFEALLVSPPPTSRRGNRPVDAAPAERFTPTPLEDFDRMLEAWS